MEKKSRTIAVHVRYESLYIFCRPLQNKNAASRDSVFALLPIVTQQNC